MERGEKEGKEGEEGGREREVRKPEEGWDKVN